jgi:glycerol-3-phosphate dehydrogenase
LDLTRVNRTRILERLTQETWDLLVIGGGIIGASTARDAALRGLKVALIEQNDFASGTSSRSSKLVHGGLRYLEQLEFGLVFEALAERTWMLETMPHLVRPLPFYFPIYQGDLHSMFQIGLGLTLYDGLSLFRTPGWHQRLNAPGLLSQIQGLKSEGLQGGFRYFDASMWDDLMVTEVLRDAVERGVCAINYCGLVHGSSSEQGFTVEDRERGRLKVRAKASVACVGAWSDQLGSRLNPEWKTWLKPSQGLHLVFDLKRFSLPGAVVMAHPSDGRISFAIPRPDLGAGITIVGTTDTPSPQNPADVHPTPDEQKYLFELLDREFPGLKLTPQDLVSQYVGIRPLIGPPEVGSSGASNLAQISREHEIKRGPQGTWMVAGGKYTTHRSMAEEIVNHVLTDPALVSESERWLGSASKIPINRFATPQAQREARLRMHGEIAAQDHPAFLILIDRYGSEAFQIWDQSRAIRPEGLADPEGFPALHGTLAHMIRYYGVTSLSDFYFRRSQLCLARRDGGLPWAESLSQVLAQFQGWSDADRVADLELLKSEWADFSKNSK